MTVRADLNKIFGREATQSELASALDGSFDGSGGLVMLVNEPGIGKTRLAQKLLSTAGGGKILMVRGTARHAPALELLVDKTGDVVLALGGNQSFAS